jgi:hypothetical protein
MFNAGLEQHHSPPPDFYSSRVVKKKRSRDQWRHGERKILRGNKDHINFAFLDYYTHFSKSMEYFTWTSKSVDDLKSRGRQSRIVGSKNWRGLKGDKVSAPSVGTKLKEMNDDNLGRTMGFGDGEADQCMDRLHYGGPCTCGRCCYKCAGQGLLPTSDCGPSIFYGFNEDTARIRHQNE